MTETTSPGETESLSALARAMQAAGYHFITPTPATHARVNARPGAVWAGNLRDVFGWSRPFRAGVVPGHILELMRQAHIVSPDGDGALRSSLRLSSLDGLLLFHSAYPTAAADSVFFGPDTYRFAQAIGSVLDRPVRRAVDLGCGAGPGAILIARANPAAEVLAVDINPRALRLTRANAAAAGVRVVPVLSDLLAGVSGTFDLIVANPPYLIDPAERAYRHGGGALGAGLSLAILDTACERLAPGGRLLLYTGAAILDGEDKLRSAVASRVADGFDWSYREVDPDVFGEELEGGAYVAADRIAAVVLTLRKFSSLQDELNARW